MSLYDEKDVVQFHVQKAEILGAASRVLGDHRDPGDETDAWLAGVIASRYANQPRNVTVDETAVGIEPTQVPIHSTSPS